MGNTLVGHSGTTLFVQNSLVGDTIVENSCGKLSRDTLMDLMGHPLLWDTLVEDTLVGHSRGTLTLVGHSCGTFLWVTRACDTLAVGHAGQHPCRTLLPDTVAGHSCTTLLWDTLVGHSKMSCFFQDTSSKNYATFLS